MWLVRHKTLAMSIEIGFSAFLLVFVAMVPIFQNARMISGKIKTKSAELDSLTTKVSILSKLDQNVLEERVNVLDNALPPKKDVLLYLTSISGLSNELGLTFEGLSLSPGDLTEATGSGQKTVAKSGLQSLETEIKIQGNQEGLYAFLRTIEGVLPLMQIKNVKVSILGDNQYSLSVTLGMLWAEPATLDVKGPVTLFGTEEDKYFQQLSEYRRFDVVQSTPIEQNINTDIFSPVSRTILQTTETQSTPKPDVVIPQQ